MIISETTSIKTSDLHNLNVNTTKLAQVFGISYNSDNISGKVDQHKINYNYYTRKSLKKALKPGNLIEDILNIICDYCGITQWSLYEKSKDISIVNSNDNNIEYAILTQTADTNQMEDKYHNVFFNEWIDLSGDKSIFRYIFKYFVND